LGRIKIRFESNQHELSSESIFNPERRKDFLISKKHGMHTFKEMAADVKH
jgi:hypothetical protein